jgi:hypothetical protein
VHWPDFGEVQLVVALQEYTRRHRRFGLLEDGEPAPDAGVASPAL